jgi:transcriptional regulator with PAS, ATPase and Fis domain
MANSAYQALYGDVMGQQRHCYQVSHRYRVPCDQAGESCPLRQSLETRENTRVLHVHHTPRGEEYVGVEMWPVKDPHDGEIRHFIEIMRPSTVASAGANAEGLVGRSPAFRHALALVERVAPSDASVMLLGESGTGKELLAQAVHRLSTRSTGPLVPVECTGMPESLFESELFGHVKGAFTGATGDKPGLVEVAARGTLFLDEVGDIPLGEQVKLLRLLETRRFRRVGSTDWREADFRLVCATHRDLAAMVHAGTFREDLYYRLNVFEIELPPLRERREDIVPLVDSMLARLGVDGRVRVGDDAMACLLAYAFPGNVRELRNLVERASLLADDGVIRPEHLPKAVREAAGKDAVPASTHAAHPADRLIPLAQLEDDYLRGVVATHTSDRRRLAQALGISERALYRKLVRLRRGD